MKMNHYLIGVILLTAIAGAQASEGTFGSPEKALQQLKDGNRRFLSGKSQHPRQTPERLKEIAEKGQKPFVTILGCSDSREPLEPIFDQGFGDLFVIRIAGNVCDTDEIGSIEYGVGHLKTPLVLVMGHTKCGAVTAVATKAEVGGSIPKLVDNIQPAVDAVKKEHPEWEKEELVPDAIRANVFQSIQDLLTHSEEVRELVAEGQVRVIGAIYNLEDGTIKWLGDHPRQSALLRAHQEENAEKKEERHH